MLSREEALSALVDNKELWDDSNKFILAKLLEIEEKCNFYNEKIVQASQVVRELSPLLSESNAAMKAVAAIAADMISEETMEALNEKL